jgi:hypothetical protein
VEHLALVDDVFVEAARLFIGHEGLDALVAGLEAGLADDGLAQLAGFLRDDVFGDFGLHKLFLPAAGVLPARNKAIEHGFGAKATLCSTSKNPTAKPLVFQPVPTMLLSLGC